MYCILQWEWGRSRWIEIEEGETEGRGEGTDGDSKVTVLIPLPWFPAFSARTSFSGKELCEQETDRTDVKKDSPETSLSLSLFTVVIISICFFFEDCSLDEGSVWKKRETLKKQLLCDYELQVIDRTAWIKRGQISCLSSHTRLTCDTKKRGGKQY